jgi:hypothetical protein
MDPWLVVQTDPAPDAPGQDDAALTAEATRLGVELQPLHPGVSDPALAGWYAVRVRPEQRAEVLSALRALPSVVAAYEKPQDAAP